MESINGRSYEVVTFKTAITAVRSGKLEIAAKDAKAIVQVPRRNNGTRPRSPFDIFGMDDPFSDPFFNDPFAGVGEQREVKFSSDTTTLDIKPLPPNAPADFSGAVGIFSLTTDVKPKTAQIGDPLTVTANISGRGNFDRVTAPVLENDRGWHTYPPGSSFKPDDDIGISGSKTFEMVFTPNEQKKAVPPLVFSYFNPLKEMYVTLKSDPLPVVVEGGTAPATTPAVASASTPTARPTAAPQAQDILISTHGSRRLGYDLYACFSSARFLGSADDSISWLDWFLRLEDAEPPPPESRRAAPRPLGAGGSRPATQAASGE